MLEGSKTFTLFHPAHRKYIEKEDNEWPDLMRPPDRAAFPDQHKAVPAQTLLKAGEVCICVDTLHLSFICEVQFLFPQCRANGT